MEDGQVLASRGHLAAWKPDAACAGGFSPGAQAFPAPGPAETAASGLEDLSGKKRSAQAGDGGASPSSAGDISTGDKRRRGRPPGSGRRQLLAVLGDWFAQSAGGNFTPHVITVPTGEDVAAKIMSFAQKGPRAICILSANGSISNVTLRQPGSAGGTLTYEGRFEIVSLSGCFTTVTDGGVRSRTGGMSVSLAGPDGRMVGGGVAGALLAASPIQVVVGSFLPFVMKQSAEKPKPLSARPTPAAANTELVGADGESPSPPFSSPVVVSWHGLQRAAGHRTSPDMNLRPSAA